MKKSKGFGIVAVIAVVAIVAVVALIAWRVTTNGKSGENNQNNSATGNTQNNNANTGEVTPTPDTAKYLDLKELGVKIKLDDKTADITYIYDTPTDGRADGAWIIDPSMKSLDNANSYCAGATAGKIGRIDKSQDQNYWSEAPLVVDNKTAFKLGEFYYVFRPLQAECSQDTGMAQQRALRVENFKAVLNTIQAK